MTQVRRRTRWTALLATAGLVTTGAVGVVAATSAAAAEGCSVDYRVTNEWSGGFQADVTVTNLGDPISSWELGWTAASGQSVTQAWNAEVTQSGSTVTASGVGWNSNLAADGSASFGFIGTWSGSNPVPGAFTLDGVACTGDVGEPDPTPTPDPTDDPTPPSSELYVDVTNQSYEAWQAASGTDKDLLAKIAHTPQAYWVGNWNDATTEREAVADYTGRAVADGTTPILAVYAIPGRDCGNHSGGGVEQSEYAHWIDEVAAGIQGSPYIVLEPDALAQLGDCDGQGDRVGYLRYAAEQLTNAGGRVYIDAGHSGWLSPSEAADRLNQIGFEHAVGFALNTSNYNTTAAERAYGEQISALTGGARFVIDTSRNGNGSNGEWCNPRGRALGERPAVVTEPGGLDALLWVKLPGESDGTCNGGPSAGAWWQEIALEMAENASW
ncbi:glycoside hydrolase family 6 protein [Isoptericola sp. S6320L]|uniref:glycoside hydrolase family 6 protein n=1 Tax=Isoptericola sp. S6320L TaxID=2926411 RepID=UPI001FF2B5C9|nr:glycoside hydrolase family 6 protein [Isoptericola sp. S6320L]MCK0118825.1 glycoside hydrolase family 6 protein [Isoptericola sp. S6320L]